MALPLALAIVLAMTISVGTVIEFASSSSRGASLNLKRQDVKAFAEAGVAHGASVLGQELADDETFAGNLSGTATIQGASVPWSATYQPTSPKSWLVSATSSRPNPAGPAGSPVVRTVQSELELATDVGVWNFVYVKPAPGSCLTFSNTFEMSSSLYVDGNFCLQNSARYTGPRLYVNGTMQTDNSASVGTAVAPIPTVSVKNSGAGSGCRYTSSGSFALPCTGAGHKVWSTSFNTSIPDYDKPTLDLAGEYAAAAPGSSARNHRCYAASMSDLDKMNGEIAKNWSTSRAGAGWAGASHILDKDTVRNDNDAGNGVVDLMPQGASYDCRQYSSSGAQRGRVAWTYGTPGTLTVEGILFFDADIKIAKTDGIVNGSGQIYANNKIVFENLVSVCGVTDCGPSWDPNSVPPHLLFLYAGHTGNPSLEVQNSARFQGGLFANGGMTIGNSAMVHGPVMADQLNAQNSADFNPWPWFATLPDGVPGTTKALRFKPGTWRD